MPNAFSQYPWIRGERECLTGQPVTKALTIVSRESAIDRMKIPERLQQGQQGQPQYGEIVAPDFRKELDALAFQLIGADAGQQFLAAAVDIAVDEKSE